MNSIKIYPVGIQERMENLIDLSWDIFLNQYINKKYEINLEAPFQLHFASVLKHIGEMFCFHKQEIFSINLEVDMGIENRNYVDIAISFYDRDTDQEFLVPIELKFKTEKQSAEDIGVMEIYKDIYNLEKVLIKLKKEKIKIPFCYFFCITDNQRYINKPYKGLKTIYASHDGYKIIPGYEYKYLETKTGKDFYEKYGSFVFEQSYQFDWEVYETPGFIREWFLKMKLK